MSTTSNQAAAQSSINKSKDKSKNKTKTSADTQTLSHAHYSESTLYLVRHGEIATPGILAGKTDVALSDKGWQQLSHSVANLAKIDVCISSPLKRCRLFAEDFCQQHHLDLVIDKQLAEMNFGDWDGKSYQTLWQANANNDAAKTTENFNLGDFWQNPWQYAIKNAEHISDFTDRVDAWWHNWLSQQNHQQANTCSLIFAHGGVIKHLLARILAMPIPGTGHMSAIDVPYASVIKISVCHDSQGKHWPRLVL
ncbi:histidine phosphatase family protein [Thalassotalea sp. PLHSN55]|uniref:histidine phosphatase family protein n=1 Tax=Thalassotalea sp. PLHSN55 TaxID=3435888 RepID=UPI003F85A106